jgi:hypothetical protein
MRVKLQLVMCSDDGHGLWCINPSDALDGR